MSDDATKIAHLTREDAVFIVDTYMLDGYDSQLVLNAAAMVLEFEEDRARGLDYTGTKPFIVTQDQAEDIANKYKIAGPAQHLALTMWALVLQWRRGLEVPDLPDADPANDIAYNPIFHRFYPE